SISSYFSIRKSQTPTPGLSREKAQPSSLHNQTYPFFYLIFPVYSNPRCILTKNSQKKPAKCKKV
ncbi:hypothetical protein, partial [Aggregatibacter actinomycetemcomitans]|uniref:hypothetical protein n=1 Tax=Aggregatibacter actinomycetemcomitans TaxID=714 RepID=UPI001E289644